MWEVIPSAIADFPWQWQQIQLTLISAFSQTLHLWEKASLCPHSIKTWSLSLLNMLIHLEPPPHPPLCLSAHEAPTGPLLWASSLVAWWAWTSSPARLCVGQRRGRRRGAGRNPIDHPCHIWWTHWPLHWYSRWSGRASLPLHSRHILSKAHHLRLLCWISGVKKDLETVVLETGRHNYVQSQSNHTHILMCNNYTQDCIQSECIHRLTR